MSNPLITAGLIRVVTVSNDTLFGLAARYLGDAMQWTRIARANNLVDPWIVGPVTLTIPPVNAKLGNGGILQ